MGDCRHRLLGEVVLTRCAMHSNGYVEVWTWHDGPLAPTLCPCVLGDRFLVAHERTAAEWLAHADVVLTDPQPDLRAAFRAARQFGHAVTVLPVRGFGTVFRTPRKTVRRPELCGICVYPWLVRADWSARAALGRRAAHRSPRTDQEPA